MNAFRLQRLRTYSHLFASRNLEAAYQSASLPETGTHTIIAMCDAYVDFLSSAGLQAAGTPLFKLNDTELTIESFQLKQELLMTQITADRLSPDYIDHLIYSPMQAAIDFATTDLQIANEETNEVQTYVNVGALSLASDAGQEIVGLVQERKVLLERAKADLIQRQIEIDGQQRRLKAQQDDLAQRLELDNQITLIHRFVLPVKATIEFNTYSGAFVKKKDVICTIRPSK